MSRLTKKELEEENESLREGLEEAYDTLSAALGYEEYGQSENGEESDEGRLVKVKRFAVKPMTVDEAILQMELLGHSFFFFEKADTGTAAVVYRRADGDIGMIEAVP